MLDLKKLFKSLFYSSLIFVSAGLFAEIQNEFKEDVCHRTHHHCPPVSPRGPSGTQGPSGATGATGLNGAPAIAAFYSSTPAEHVQGQLLDFDVIAVNDGAISTNGIQFTVNVPGVYNIEIGLMMDALIPVQVTFPTEVALKVNGVNIPNGAIVFSSNVAPVVPGFKKLSVLVDLNVGDVVTAEFFSDVSVIIGVPGNTAYLEFVKIN